VIEKDIATIESGYEFLLAYAAQGRPAQQETGPGPHARTTLQGIAEAMKNVSTAFADSKDNFEQVIADDCRKAGAALEFILKQKFIGSELVDNLNASIHLRAVLTDLFLYSEAFRPLAAEYDSAAGPSGSPGCVETYDATQSKG